MSGDNNKKTILGTKGALCSRNNWALYLSQLEAYPLSFYSVTLKVMGIASFLIYHDFESNSAAESKK